jgi:hypothetical protein
MDEYARILQAIAVFAQLGAQHAADRAVIEQLTARVKQLTSANNKAGGDGGPAAPPAKEEL